MIAQINAKQAFLVNACPLSIGPSFIEVPLRDLRSEWSRFTYLCRRMDIVWIRAGTLLQVKDGVFWDQASYEIIWRVVWVRGSGLGLVNHVESEAIRYIDGAARTNRIDKFLGWKDFANDVEVANVLSFVSTNDARPLVSTRIQEILTEQEQAASAPDEAEDDIPVIEDPTSQSIDLPPAPSIWNRLKEEEPSP